MKLSRRAVLAAAALPMPALAQTRSIRLVVPFAAGGAADSAARTLAPRMAERLGATIVVENRTGAGGSIGGAEVARAAATVASVMRFSVPIWSSGPQTPQESGRPVGSP